MSARRVTAEHLAKSLAIFADMVGKKVSATEPNGLWLDHQAGGYRVEMNGTKGGAHMPFGNSRFAPGVMLDTLHFAVYAMRMAQLNEQVVTIVVGKYNNDTDVDLATQVYSGTMEDEVAVQRAAKDLAREWSDGNESKFTAEGILKDWTFQVFSQAVLK